MSIRRKAVMAMASACVILLVISAPGKSAQNADEPTKSEVEAKGERTINSTCFKVKIVNKTGTDVIATSSSFVGHFRQPIKDGESYTTPYGEYFQKGEKVIAAFDDFKENVVCVGIVEIKEKTLITLEQKTPTYKPLPEGQ